MEGTEPSDLLWHEHPIDDEVRDVLQLARRYGLRRDGVSVGALATAVLSRWGERLPDGLRQLGFNAAAVGSRLGVEIYGGELESAVDSEGTNVLQTDAREALRLGALIATRANRDAMGVRDLLAGCMEVNGSDEAAQLRALLFGQRRPNERRLRFGFSQTDHPWDLPVEMVILSRAARERAPRALQQAILEGEPHRNVRGALRTELKEGVGVVVLLDDDRSLSLEDIRALSGVADEYGALSLAVPLDDGTNPEEIRRLVSAGLPSTHSIRDVVFTVPSMSDLGRQVERILVAPQAAPLSQRSDVQTSSIWSEHQVDGDVERALRFAHQVGETTGSIGVGVLATSVLTAWGTNLPAGLASLGFTGATIGNKLTIDLETVVDRPRTSFSEILRPDARAAITTAAQIAARTNRTSIGLRDLLVACVETNDSEDAAKLRLELYGNPSSPPTSFRLSFVETVRPWELPVEALLATTTDTLPRELRTRLGNPLIKEFHELYVIADRNELGVVVLANPERGKVAQFAAEVRALKVADEFGAVSIAIPLDVYRTTPSEGIREAVQQLLKTLTSNLPMQSLRNVVFTAPSRSWLTSEVELELFHQRRSLSDRRAHQDRALGTAPVSPPPADKPEAAAVDTRAQHQRPATQVVVAGNPPSEAPRSAAAPRTIATNPTRRIQIQKDRLTIEHKTRSLPPNWLDTPVAILSTSFRLRDVRDVIQQVTDRADVERLGDVLGNILFPDETSRAVLTVTERADIRLVLDLDDDAAGVPWEYLRVEETFLLDRRVSILRHCECNGAPLGLRMAPLARVLFAWANPKKDFDDRVHTTQIENAVRKARASVIPLPKAAKADLLKELAKSDFDAFHFLGHGLSPTIGNASLVVHKAADSAETVEALSDELVSRLQNGSCRFALLGSCYSGVVPPKGAADDRLDGIANAIVRDVGIPVVAMQVEVPQLYSTDFVSAFYEELAETGGNIERAVHRARHAGELGRIGFGMPVLYADANAADDIEELPDMREAPIAGSIVVNVAEAARLFESFRDDLPAAIAGALEKVKKELPNALVASPVASRSDPNALATAAKDIMKLAGMAEADQRVAQVALKGQLADAPKPSDHPPLSATIRTDFDPPFRPVWDRLAAAFADIETKLILPQGLLQILTAELAAGRHVLLIGPVGTGKSSLATALCAALGYDAFSVTASSDWTPFEVVGGFWPHPITPIDGGASGFEFRFRPGAVTEAVWRNWMGSTENDVATWSRRTAGGTWLILDELNRADMDRAMGPLFTALETRKLRLPYAGEQSQDGTSELPIPRDFRIIATLNGVDRHYLFRLSDALKRRFAWVEVPIATDWKGELEILLKSLDAQSLRDDSATRSVRKLAYLARLLHPLGTAQLRSALAFLQASSGSGLDDRRRVAQAVGGSLLPTVEDAPPLVHQCLYRWAQGAAPADLAISLQQAANDRGKRTGEDESPFHRSLAAIDLAELPELAMPAIPAGVNAAIATAARRLSSFGDGPFAELEPILRERAQS
ncbi:MAG: AAA domain-containing protein [Polyangiaceae bacterium]|nr:AAA domain-containing protein [Polyangiaceae bacterium]